MENSDKANIWKHALNVTNKINVDFEPECLCYFSEFENKL